jgi:hypothetical protein
MDVPGGQQIFIRYNEGAGTTPGTKWDTGDARNLDWMLRGKAGWRSDRFQVLVSNGPNESDRQWLEVEQQEVFLANPAPTIELTNPTATSLRVRLAGQKRNVRILPAAPAQPIAIEHTITGTDCPPP